MEQILFNFLQEIQGVEVGIFQIIELLNNILTPEQTTTVLLETMAGKGTEIGSRFEELRQIDGVLSEFDNIIGLDLLKAIHLNDSMNGIGSHKDRHQCIGKGSIGLDAFRKIVTHPKLSHLPFYLETPNDIEGYKAEIELLRSFI